jgi:transposase InsO family protein
MKVALEVQDADLGARIKVALGRLADLDQQIAQLFVNVVVDHGFLYLVASMDWASRAVLSWRLSNTMDMSFCVAALEEALQRFGKPQIFSTDQGSQFTSMAFTSTLRRAGIQQPPPSPGAQQSHPDGDRATAPPRRLWT